MTSHHQPQPSAPGLIHVVAGVIVNSAGEVLVARRPPQVHQGGLWEFPGGKVESGEAPQRALARELWEELGITVLDARPLIQVRHRYPDKGVLLDAWRVSHYLGEAHGREGQPVRWVPPEELPALSFPAANHPVVTAARLPRVYLITGQTSVADCLARLEGALGAGIRLAQLRAKHLDPRDYEALARNAIELGRAYGARILLNAAPTLAKRLEADGVHLSTARLMTHTRRPLGPGKWVGASCHNTHEIEHAQRIGVDFVVLAPVLPTTSHPGAATLGWDGFADLASRARLPVFALGGMAPAHHRLAAQCGAQGIAAIGALWDAPDIAASVRAALHED